VPDKEAQCLSSLLRSGSSSSGSSVGDLQSILYGGVSELLGRPQGGLDIPKGKNKNKKTPQTPRLQRDLVLSSKSFTFHCMSNLLTLPLIRVDLGIKTSRVANQEKQKRVSKYDGEDRVA